MKKRYLIIVTLLLACLLSSCSSDKTDKKTPSDDSGNKEITSTQNPENKKPESTPTPLPQKETLTINEFDELLLTMPLHVINTKYLIQDENYKSLYPDILSAEIKNTTSMDVKNAVVAFVAWDNNNLPIKLKGDIDFSDGSYIKNVNYSDINLAPGQTYGSKSGYSIAQNLNIDSFKAIVVSFESFDGTTWENPYFNAFCDLYEGKKYADDLTIEVTLIDLPDFSSASNGNNNSADINEDELSAILSEQNLSVISTKYIIQDENYKSLYPDMLSAVIQNNTSEDIKDAVVAFVAWDDNNLPVKLKGDIDFSDGSYIKQVNYSDINLAANGTYGSGSGFSIAQNLNIATFKAIPVSYVTFDGETWENPYFKDFCTLYEGKKIEVK